MNKLQKLGMLVLGVLLLTALAFGLGNCSGKDTGAAVQQAKQAEHTATQVTKEVKKANALRNQVEALPDADLDRALSYWMRD